MVRKAIIIFLVSMAAMSTTGQIINKEKIRLSKFIERLYKNCPFSGVKVINDDDTQYLLSVVILNPEKYKKNEIIMSRVSSVKAMTQASSYFNGSSISAETVINTKEKSNGTNEVEITEKIRENSIGWVSSLELLHSFFNEKGELIYVYSKTMEHSEVIK